MRKWLMGAICAALVVAAPQSARAFSDGHELLEAAESKNIVEEAMFVCMSPEWPWAFGMYRKC